MAHKRRDPKKEGKRPANHRLQDRACWYFDCLARLVFVGDQLALVPVRRDQ